jgi:hypothetical protein
MAPASSRPAPNSRAPSPSGAHSVAPTTANAHTKGVPAASARLASRFQPACAKAATASNASAVCPINAARWAVRQKRRLFGYALSWLFVYVPLRVPGAQSTQAALFVFAFPLTFISSVFVPTRT